MIPKTAILIGATGLTGSCLLNDLLENNDFTKIIIFSRKTTGIKHPKIEEHIIDLFKIKNYKHLIQGDVAFCCIGTTRSKTPDKEIYTKIDCGIPSDLAIICNENKVDCFLVISSMGAKANSNTFYLKTKGMMERLVLNSGIKNIYVLRPSIIIGNRNEKRFTERFVKILFKCFDFFMVGIFEPYKSIHAKDIAKAMIILSKVGFETSILQSNQIQKLANG